MFISISGFHSLDVHSSSSSYNKQNAEWPPYPDENKEYTLQEGQQPFHTAESQNLAPAFSLLLQYPTGF